MATAGPLAGTRVVEAANFMSGPFAGMMLADLGAEVVKVEPPAGDPFRRFGRPETAMSAVFANCNRGKRSEVLDLKAPADLERMLALLREADVFLCNWRPGAAARLGLGDAVLDAANPRLVRVYITGYGDGGPYAADPAFDSVVQGVTGMTFAASPTDDPALSPGYPIDKLTSVMAVQATLAALLARGRTGRGDRVDVAMLDVGAYHNFVELFANRVFVDGAPVDARNHHARSLRPLPARDGWIVIAPVSSHAVRQACVAIGRAEWADELLAERDQVVMLTALLDRFAEVTPSETVAEWMERFAAHDVAAAQCLGIDEHLADPQVAHNELYRVDDTPGLGRVRSVRYPALFKSVGPLTGQGGPPLLSST